MERGTEDGLCPFVIEVNLHVKHQLGGRTYSYVQRTRIIKLRGT